MSKMEMILLTGISYIYLKEKENQIIADNLLEFLMENKFLDIDYSFNSEQLKNSINNYDYNYMYSKNNNNMYNKPYVIRYIKNYRRRIE